MAKHMCKICEKEFGDSAKLKRHMKRKYPCHINDKYMDTDSTTCLQCNKLFSSKRTLLNHVRNYCKTTGESGTIINNNNTTNNNMNTANTYIDTQQNMNVDGDVKLVKFGDENLSYISDDLFKSILGRGFKSIEELVDHSHFNPDHPENHNIYISNIQSDFVIIYDGKKWNIDKKEDIFEDIIYAKSDFLCMKFKELMSKMNEVDIKKFEKFINERDEDKTMNKIKGELKLQLYNGRDLPQKLRKQLEGKERQMLKIQNKKSRDVKGSDRDIQKNIIDELLAGADEETQKKVINLLNGN